MSQQSLFVDYIVCVFSSAWPCEQSYYRGAGVHHSSAAVIQGKFVGSYLSTISPDYFFIFGEISIFKFLRFFFFLAFVNMETHGRRISTCCFFHRFVRFLPNFIMKNMVVMGGYSLLDDGAKIKNLWHFNEILLGPHEAPPTVFIWSHPNFRTSLTMGEYRLFFFLATDQVKKNCSTFKL